MLWIFRVWHFDIQFTLCLLIVLEVFCIGCLVISYIAKKVDSIFRRLEMVVINFLNYNFGRIDFISLELQHIFPA